MVDPDPGHQKKGGFYLADLPKLRLAPENNHPYTAGTLINKNSLAKFLSTTTAQEKEYGKKCFYAICKLFNENPHGTFGGSISLKSLKQLGHMQSKEYMTDEIIAFVMKHYQKLFDFPALPDGSLYLSTYYAELLANIAGVNQQTKRTPHNTLQSEFKLKSNNKYLHELDRVVFIYNQYNCHWVTAIVLPQKKKLEIFDSNLTMINGQPCVINKNTFKALWYFVCYQYFVAGIDINPDEWKLLFGRKCITQQTDSYSCGLYSMLNAVSALYQLDLRVVSKELMMNFRNSLLLYICQKPVSPVRLKNPNFHVTVQEIRKNLDIDSIDVEYEESQEVTVTGTLLTIPDSPNKSDSSIIVVEDNDGTNAVDACLITPSQNPGAKEGTDDNASINGLAASITLASMAGVSPTIKSREERESRIIIDKIKIMRMRAVEEAKKNSKEQSQHAQVAENSDMKEPPSTFDASENQQGIAEEEGPRGEDEPMEADVEEESEGGDSSTEKEISSDEESEVDAEVISVHQEISPANKGCDSVTTFFQDLRDQDQLKLERGKSARKRRAEMRLNFPNQLQEMKMKEANERQLKKQKKREEYQSRQEALDKKAKEIVEKVCKGPQKKKKVKTKLLESSFKNTGPKYGEKTKVDQLFALKYNGTTKLYDGKQILEENPDGHCVVSGYSQQWARKNFHPVFLRVLKLVPGTFMKIPLGASKDDVAPMEVHSKVKTNYVQLDKAYCLYYSMASALHYCACQEAGRHISNHAKKYAFHGADEQMVYLIGLIQSTVPSIGRFVKFNLKTAKKKKKKKLDIANLCEQQTPFPTIVIPQCVDGGVNHAVTVVDDLIFDSTQTNALKLTKESFDWICAKNGGFQKISGAYRFNSQERTKEVWKRTIVKHT